MVAFNSGRAGRPPRVGPTSLHLVAEVRFRLAISVLGACLVSRYMCAYNALGARLERAWSTLSCALGDAL